MCTVLLPPGVNQIAVDKYNIYIYISNLLPNFVTISKTNNCNMSCRNWKPKIVNVAKMYYNTTGSLLYVCCNAEARSCKHCCSGKAINITYFVCVCVCVCVNLFSSMQCASAIWSFTACSTVTYFSTLSHKRLDFRKKVIECKMFVLISASTFFFWNISHSKKNWAICDQKCI
jgi:hypothetical protein